MEGHLEVLLEMDFCTKPPNFGVEAHMEAPAGDALRTLSCYFAILPCDRIFENVVKEVRVFTRSPTLAFLHFSLLRSERKAACLMFPR
jgi:hypothetical protein